MNRKIVLILILTFGALFCSSTVVKAASCGIRSVAGQATTFEQYVQLDSALNPNEGLVFFIHNDTEDRDILFIRSFQQYCSGTSCSLVGQDLTSQLPMLRNIVARGDTLSIYIMQDPSPPANYALPPISSNAQQICSNMLNTSVLTPEIGSPREAITAETFDALNPLNLFSEGVEEDLTTPGGILTRVLHFAFPIAGFILFIMLIWAGFEIVSGATNGQKSLDAGKQRATAAIVGFILLFISYFVAQLLQVVFGIKIL